MTDDDVHRAFSFVEQELERLRTQHVTCRRTSKSDKSVRIDPASVPLPDSDESRSPSPTLRSSPSCVMQRAHDSGQFSSADLRLFQNAFDAATSVSTTKELPHPTSCGFNTKLHPYGGTPEPFDTFIARFENFSSHFQ